MTPRKATVGSIVSDLNSAIQTEEEGVQKRLTPKDGSS